MFKFGDKVEWSSQARGSEKKKKGIIVEVVPAGTWPSKTLDRLRGSVSSIKVRYRVMFDGGLPRKSDSYLVAVPPKTSRGKPFLYWPRTSALRKLD
jgi:hypothetical protein